MKSMSNSTKPLPTDIEGTSCQQNIVNLWKKHFYDLFNCIKRNVNEIENVERIVKVECSEVKEAISKLDVGKSCDTDGINMYMLSTSSSMVQQ